MTTWIAWGLASAALARMGSGVLVDVEVVNSVEPRGSVMFRDGRFGFLKYLPSFFERRFILLNSWVCCRSTWMQ